VGLQEPDAADVGQEVFRAVAGAIAQFHHDQQGDTFRGWLRTITWNKLRDFARRARKETVGQGGSDALGRLLEVPAENPPDTDASAIEEDNLLVYRQALELILAEFSDTSSKAFLRVVVDQQAPADVAAELGISVNAVYLARSRILARLRAEFAELLPP
jgi:RNA polymerase sigma-70 factor (ECF subfamily)